MKDELWAITVNGTTYAVTSTDGEAIGSIVSALASQVQAAGYTTTGTSGSKLVVNGAIGTTVTGFGTVVLDNQETTANVTVTATGPTTTIALTGDVSPNVTWTLTVDGTKYSTTATAGETLNAIANSLRTELLQERELPRPGDRGGQLDDHDLARGRHRRLGGARHLDRGRRQRPPPRASVSLDSKARRRAARCGS